MKIKLTYYFLIMMFVCMFQNCHNEQSDKYSIPLDPKYSAVNFSRIAAIKMINRMSVCENPWIVGFENQLKLGKLNQTQLQATIIRPVFLFQGFMSYSTDDKWRDELKNSIQKNHTQFNPQYIDQCFSYIKNYDCGAVSIFNMESHFIPVDSPCYKVIVGKRTTEQSCSNSFECPNTDECIRATPDDPHSEHTCQPKSFIQVGMQSDCGHQGKQYLSCQAAAYCRNEPTKPMGTCQPMSPVGGPCAQHDACLSAHCGYYVCADPQKNGAYCQDSGECESFVCQNNHCVDAYQEVNTGEYCRLDDPKDAQMTLPICKSDAYCRSILDENNQSTLEGICVAYQQLADPCDETQKCDPSLTCHEKKICVQK